MKEEKAAMKVLYLTYDGLTSQIGQSQVLPYIIGLAKRGYGLHVVSFERRDDMSVLGEAVAAALADVGVGWIPRRFKTKPPIFAKVVDQFEARWICDRLVRRGDFSAIHCRSYFSADVGIWLKQRHRIKMIFDMRGFWVDQRLEGGRWPQKNPFYRSLYNRWKEKEAKFVAQSDEIVSLTHAASNVLKSWNSYKGAPIKVIPCSLDYSRFPLSSVAGVLQARSQLGIAESDFVLAYLGSLGTVYLKVEMMALFAMIKSLWPDAKFLLIGQHAKEQLVETARKVSAELTAEDFRVIHARHSEVSFWLGAANAGVCFIMPTFSSLGVSPTKLGEYLAAGLPVICNEPVGDVKEIVESMDAGVVVDGFSPEQIHDAAASILKRTGGDRERLREAARAKFDINIALDSYDEIYRRLAVA